MSDGRKWSDWQGVGAGLARLEAAVGAAGDLEAVFQAHRSFLAESMAHAFLDKDHSVCPAHPWLSGGTVVSLRRCGSRVTLWWRV